MTPASGLTFFLKFIENTCECGYFCYFKEYIAASSLEDRESS